MKTNIEYMEKVKRGSKSKVYLFLSIILFLSLNYSSAQTYLTDGQKVPVFEPANTSITNRKLYWDITEINNSNNRLDIGVGVTHYEGSNNYINGNWYMNENNSNFNSEVTGNRFIYLTNNSNTINGYIFKLNDSTGRKDAVVTRGNGEMEIYLNSNGNIEDNLQNIYVGGTIKDIGQFSNDNYEDAAVLSNSGDTVKIYKGLSNGKLDTDPYRYHVNNPYNLCLAQLSSFIAPYTIAYNVTDNKDEIVYTEEDSVKILKNTNSNTLEKWLTIYTGLDDANIKIADINNDGYNDILVYYVSGGLKIYMNNAGTGFSPGYVRSDFVFSVSAGDFNKDGWNDIVINTEISAEIFLNTKTGNFFENTPSSVYYYDYPVPVKLFYPGKSMIADLYNKGGLALIFSAFPDQTNYNWNVENIWRINASDTDAVPAPAYLFGSNVHVADSLYHPKLILFNRGDRDFLRYRIYKFNYSFYNYFLFDSTSSDQYIDTTEDMIYTLEEPVEPPEANLFYYAVAVDNSYKISITSDTIEYVAFVPFCPTCPVGPDNFAASNETTESPKEYSLSNYPNPFNPTTKINYELQVTNYVSLKVYDVLGNEIAILVKEKQNAGRYSVNFNGANLSSGIYFYRFESNGIVMTGRMLLIK